LTSLHVIVSMLTTGG